MCGAVTLTQWSPEYTGHVRGQCEKCLEAKVPRKRVSDPSRMCRTDSGQLPPVEKKEAIIEMMGVRASGDLRASVVLYKREHSRLHQSLE